MSVSLGLRIFGSEFSSRNLAAGGAFPISVGKFEKVFLRLLFGACNSL